MNAVAIRNVTKTFGRHVAVDTWRSRIAEATRLPVQRIIDAAGFLFSLYLVWLAWKMTLFVFGSGQRSPTLGLEMGWIYVAPLVGFGLLALRYLLSFLGLIDRTPAREADEA